jgi:hypothetical protein
MLAPLVPAAISDRTSTSLILRILFQEIKVIKGLIKSAKVGKNARKSRQRPILSLEAQKPSLN